MKNIFSRFFSWLDGNSAGRDYWLCLVLGALCALAMPPAYAVPVLFVAFPLLVRLLDKSLTTKQVFFKTFLFHYGFHVFGLYWVAAALFVDIQNNWWAIPFAVGSLPALMALYPALTAIFWHRLSWRGLPRLLLLGILFTLAEWVRGVAFTGFPWNLWGYTWTGFLPALQSVSLFGIYGLTLLTVLLAMIPALLTRPYKQKSAAVFATILIACFVALIAWGQGRLMYVPQYGSFPYTVRVVQPNIKQESKWDEAKRDAIRHTLWSLTLTPTKAPPHIVIWPETALSLASTAELRELQQSARDYLWSYAVLAAGVFDVEAGPDNAPRFFNRIGFYDSSGERIAKFDKAHLVPFGEFLPFQDLWPVRPVAFKAGSMTAGGGVQTVTQDVFPPVSPLICYEVLFPGKVVDRKNRPQWILNVTNDAWYGRTSGPYQHLEISRTRAVEEGLPLVRSANTGISAVIDPMGRIVEKLPLETQGVIDRPLPPALKPTPFARFGNTIFFGMLAAAGLLAFVLQRAGIRKVNHVA